MHETEEPEMVQLTGHDTAVVPDAPAGPLGNIPIPKAFVAHTIERRLTYLPKLLGPSRTRVLKDVALTVLADLHDEYAALPPRPYGFFGYAYKLFPARVEWVATEILRHDPRFEAGTRSRERSAADRAAAEYLAPLIDRVPEHRQALAHQLVSLIAQGEALTFPRGRPQPTVAVREAAELLGARQSEVTETLRLLDTLVATTCPPGA